MPFKVFSLLIKTYTLFISSLSQTPGSCWSFYCLHSFAFSRMAYSWNLFYVFLSPWKERFKTCMSAWLLLIFSCCFLNLYFLPDLYTSVLLTLGLLVLFLILLGGRLGCLVEIFHLLRNACFTMNLPLRTGFAASHRLLFGPSPPLQGLDRLQAASSRAECCDFPCDMGPCRSGPA